MKSTSAVSRYESPDAISSAIRCSVGVSSVAGARPPTRASSACAFASHKTAPSWPKIPSALSSASRAARFFAIAPEDVAEDDECAGALERLLESVVKHESLLELLVGRAEVAAGSAQEGAAAAGHDEDPGPVERRPEPVELGE